MRGQTSKAGSRAFAV
jgi:uncharacterized protein (DUF4415 family)